jgi:cation transport regulator ChaB
LLRNEEKLKEASTTHEESASRLCDLLEEAVHAGWQDLYPVLESMVDIDINTSHQQQALVSRKLSPWKQDLQEAYQSAQRDYKAKSHERTNSLRNMPDLEQVADRVAGSEGWSDNEDDDDDSSAEGNQPPPSPSKTKGNPHHIHRTNGSFARVSNV